MRSSSLLAILAKLVLVVTTTLCSVLPQAAAADGPPVATGAVLAPIAPGVIVRPYARSGLRLVSRLTDGDGRPVAGATVQTLQRVQGSVRWEAVGATVSAANGRVIAVVPPRPSRTVPGVWTAERRGFVAQTEVVETVNAGLNLRANPLRTEPEGRVTLEGRVMGSVPAGGVVVELLVYYQGSWQPIRTPRTDDRGRVRVAYRFHRAYGWFPFWLRVRQGQVGFPYGDGMSRWVEVDT
jgi:5-hydroxyisourate hydrolase-like protein (transthyretin family)